MKTIRVWDVPTRLFHWCLVVMVIGMVITGNVGGNAMVWHFRLGYAIMTLLLFRLVWGFVGGYWSRFSTFIHSPTAIMDYLRSKSEPLHHIGHNPLGAGSVLAMLAVLMAQVMSGMLSDDEIAFAGPLTSLVSSKTVLSATFYHKEVGKAILILLIVLHVAAIVYYRKKKKIDLVTPMISGNKQVEFDAPSSADTWSTKIGAAMVLAACAYAVQLIVGLGATV